MLLLLTACLSLQPILKLCDNRWFRYICSPSLHANNDSPDVVFHTPLRPLALYIYDYALTFPLEISEIWRTPRFSAATLAYLLNRYGFLLYWCLYVVVTVTVTTSVPVLYPYVNLQLAALIYLVSLSCKCLFVRVGLFLNVAAQLYGDQ